jgi:hypothetical protein
LSRIENAVTVGNLPDALHLIDNSQQEIAARNKKVKIADMCWICFQSIVEWFDYWQLC